MEVRWPRDLEKDNSLASEGYLIQKNAIQFTFSLMEDTQEQKNLISNSNLSLNTYLQFCRISILKFYKIIQFSRILAEDLYVLVYCQTMYNFVN